MKKTKALSALLAVALLLPIFASCNNESSGDDLPQVDAHQAEIAEIDEYVKKIADEKNYNGATFTYIGRSDSNFPVREEETGAVKSDAVYFRQCEIEEKFGINWINRTTRYGDDAQQLVLQSVMSDSAEYDLVYGSMLTVGQPLLLNNCLQSVEKFEHIDVSRDWWAESLDDTFTIKDKLFFLTGPIVTNHYSDTSCILFNKAIAEQYGLPNLYSLVTEGKWTVDKMFEVASIVPENSDGNGIYRYGDPSGIEWIFSSGMQIVNFKEDGTPYVEKEPPVKLCMIADKMSSVFGNDSITCCLKNKHSSFKETAPEKYGVTALENMFTDGKVLFWFTETGEISNFRSKKTEFGVLPMPMWDEEQIRYRSYASQWGGAAVYVPKTVSDTEMSGSVIESMAALSQKYVKPAFYDEMLKSSGTYDAESRGMLDIVISTKTYDIIDIFSGGDMNQWGSLMTLLDTSISEDSSPLEKEYVSNVMVITRNIRIVLNIISDSEETD